MYTFSGIRNNKKGVKTIEKQKNNYAEGEI